jgi:signal transduction histidine kinase
MFGEMLAEGRTKSPEQAHEYAEIIWRESVRLGRLIDNVLDFAKIERGKEVYEFADGWIPIEPIRSQRCARGSTKYTRSSDASTTPTEANAHHGLLKIR